MESQETRYARSTKSCSGRGTTLPRSRMDTRDTRSCGRSSMSSGRLCERGTSTTRRKKPTGGTSGEWEPPSEVVEPLAQEFGPFDLDPCAREENAKAPFYWSREDDGLQQEGAGKGGLNPPHSAPAPR